MWDMRRFSDAGLSDDGNRQTIADWFNEIELTRVITKIITISPGKTSMTIIVINTEDKEAYATLYVRNENKYLAPEPSPSVEIVYNSIFGGNTK